MRQVVFAGLLLLSVTAISQVNSSYKFATSGSNIIAYKQGTSCTASPYSFYMISDAGVQSSTPFYTIANTSREVNGIGINPIDRYLYGVEYDRDAGCAFSNFHLMRYDSQGNSEDLGTLPPVAGGTVTAALGCVTNNGNFVYSTRDALGYSHISIIADIASLPANAAAALNIHSTKQIINLAPIFSYADWAVHPSNNKMYTYGIANIGGISTGRVLELDPSTGVLQIVGLTDVTNFLDPVRDNFGGVYFGNDGMLYDVNVNTRRLYMIDALTGNITYKSTMAGSGQIRADMGSYATGWIVLPVSFEKVELVTKNETASIQWSVANNNEVKEFVVEQNTGSGFVQLKKVAATIKSQNYSSEIAIAVTAQYRIKAISLTDKVVYSSIVQHTTKNSATIKLLINPVTNNQLSFTSTLKGAYAFTITNANGAVMQKGTIACAPNELQQLSLPTLTSGVYFLQLGDEKRTTVKFVLQ